MQDANVERLGPTAERKRPRFERGVETSGLRRLGADEDLAVGRRGCQSSRHVDRVAERGEIRNGVADGADVGEPGVDAGAERDPGAGRGPVAGRLEEFACGIDRVARMVVAVQDRQEAELRAELQGTGVSVTRIGDNITLNMPGNVTFATNSADLSPAFFDVLTSVAKVLKEYEQTVVEVAGHTDSTGTDEYNQGLSERRASSVAQFLQTQGVISQRLITVGMGEARPVADNSTAEGRQANRRVEITMVPLTS